MNVFLNTPCLAFFYSGELISSKTILIIMQKVQTGSHFSLSLSLYLTFVTFLTVLPVFLHI